MTNQFFFTGFLYGKVNKDLLIAVTLVGTSTAIVAIPWCTNFYLMLFVKIVAGVLGAGFDTGSETRVSPKDYKCSL